MNEYLQKEEELVHNTVCDEKLEQFAMQKSQICTNKKKEKKHN